MQGDEWAENKKIKHVQTHSQLEVRFNDATEIFRAAKRRMSAALRDRPPDRRLLDSVQAACQTAEEDN